MLFACWLASVVTIERKKVFSRGLYGKVLNFLFFSGGDCGGSVFFFFEWLILFSMS